LLLWVVLWDIDADVTNKVFQRYAVSPWVPARISRPNVPYEGLNKELDTKGALQNDCAKKLCLH
jgi:hypothetical protein